MNPMIENLNQWGGRFLSFAWPMLWQSSLLIVLVGTLDFLFARKIRASVRYALWLAVLVKLLLPPALALPTGAVWWLFPVQPVAKTPAFKNFTVTYDQTPLPTDLTSPVVALPAPAPKLKGAGWTLLVSVAASAALLLWLAWRWWQVAQKVRNASISGDWDSLLGDARRRAGLRSGVRLKLVEGQMSPAVCGLFRPVILLPRTLAENLSAGQLRAVLLHELFHLRRKDVWVNCAQALLQIFYWWHPLVWLANARIRRVREEAVDDAVMLALGGEAESYAPTLLDVAKLAFHRPLMSLGLVGIMESRSALRQRIERLVNFQAPRKAGLTFVSCCGVLVFSAVALPMGEAPGTAQSPASIAPAPLEQQSLTLTVAPEVFIQNVKAQAGKTMLSSTNDYTAILLDLLRSEGVDCNPPHGIAFNTQSGAITTQNTPDKLDVFRRVIEQLNRADGICELPLHDNPLRKRILIEARIYQMPAADFENLASDLQFYQASRGNDAWWSASPDKFKQLVGSLESSGRQLMQRPRILTGSGMEADFFVGNATNSIEFDCKPFAEDGYVDVTMRGTITSDASAGSGFTNYFNTQASAEDHGGIVVRVENFGGDTGNNLVAFISLEVVTNAAERFQQRLQKIIQPASTNAASSAGTLVQDGKVFYEMGKFDEAEAKLKAVSAADPENQAAAYYLDLVHKAQVARQHPLASHMTPGHQKVLDKINHIQFDQVSFDNLPLSAVIRRLSEQTRLCDPEKKGINFLINPHLDTSATGLPEAAKSAGATTAPLGQVLISLNLTNVRLVDALDAVVKASGRPIKYSIEDYGIVFSPKGDESATLFTRTFKIDSAVLVNHLHQQGLVAANANSGEMMKTLRNLFAKAGVDLSATNKAVFYNDRRGIISVRATESDLDAIERIIVVFNDARPQVHIKARFIEVPGTATADVYLGNIIVPKINPTPGVFPQPAAGAIGQREKMVASAGPAALTGILNDSQFATIWRALESKPDVTILAEPEVTTLSGRQTQMRATTIITVITNFALQTNSANRNGAGITDSVVPMTSPVETGPVLATTASVLPDGYTIDLRTIASLTEFLGYDKPTNSTPVLDANGEKVDLPKTLPAFNVREAEAHVRLWDNQTLVLGGVTQETIKQSVTDADGGPNGTVRTQTTRTETKSQLLVFVTVTLVDAAGNRVHSDDEMPFEQNGIPPQEDLY